MIKNIFFDLDGTVVNSEEGILQGIKIAMDKYGYDIPNYSVLRKCIGPPFSVSFPEIFNVSEDDYPMVLKEYRDFYESGGMYKCCAYKGIEELLLALVNRGYSINICSSKPENSCKAVLDYLGLSKYFSDIVGATKDGRIDTKAQVIEECFRRAPWKKKEETILIGDTKFDADGAIESDLTCIGITWGFGTKEELLNAGAKAVFDTCEEELEYVEQN